MSEADQPQVLVSLIIPAHNVWEMTEACLESVRANTRVPHEIILVDDASEPATAARMRALGGGAVTVLRNEQRLSFSANNNRAAALARGRHLCLLNNDTLVTPGWLEPLVRAAEEHADVGVVGNKQLFPKSGLLHHCGIAFDREGHPLHLHPHTDPAAPAANYQRDLQAVTFACVLIPRRVYEQLGGLDERYRNSYEDVDFCLRAREAGYRVVYTPASTIYHHGQATPGRTERNAANWEVFRSRWAGRAALDLEELTRRDREYNRFQQHRPRLRREGGEGLHFAVDFSKGSAFVWAAAEMIAALGELGEHVSVLPSPSIHRGVGREKARLIAALMKRPPCRSLHLKFSHYWPDHLNQPLAGEVNAEFFVTNFAYPAGARRLDPWLEHVRANGYRKLPVSRFNLEVLAGAGVPPEDCSLVPLGYAPEVERLFPRGKEAAGDAGDLQLLVVTNSHDLRRYGTDLLVDALAEAFGPEDPVVVHVKDYGEGAANGDLARWIASKPRFPRVVWHRRFIGKDELIRLYARMDLLVAPFRGEGFGMKVIDAMALGVPVLMPAFGGPADFAATGVFLPLEHDVVPMGDCLDRRGLFVGDGASWCQVRMESLVGQLRSLPARRTELRETGRLALEHVRGRFSWREAARRLVEARWTWQQSRLAVVAARRGPAERPLTVVLPTKDRPEALGKALQGYLAQELPRSDYEIILVNDYGDPGPVRELVQRHSPALPIALIENQGRRGPAAARNLALEKARGEVVLFVGDDIIPAANLLSAHLAAHRRHRELEGAVLGRTLWHEEIAESPFLRYICGEGGQQFDYRRAREGRVLPAEHFYTSNVSVKRDFLIEELPVFSERFPLAAYEDVELAFRLHLRGMRLRYAGGAVARHLHPTTPASFLTRQVAAGRMLTVLCSVQPAYVPETHQGFLRALETARCRGLLGACSAERLAATDSLLAALLAAYEDVQGAAEAEVPGEEGICERTAARLHTWFAGRGLRMWEALNEIAIRRGMAEEWGRDDEEKRAARHWATLLCLPAVLRAGDAGSALTGAERESSGGVAALAGNRLVAGAARWARFNPWLLPLVGAAKKTRLGAAMIAAIGRRAGGG